MRLLLFSSLLPACICSAGVAGTPRPCRGADCDAGADASDGSLQDAGPLPDGSVPDASRCDECIVARTVRFDSKEELLTGTPVLEATEVDPTGFVSLAGYQTGALLVTGWPDASFDDARAATWSDAAFGEPSGRRFDGNANRTFAEPIPGIGLTDGAAVVTWEGEVYLQYPSEVYTFTLDAADRAFLEVLDDGEWRRVLVAEDGGAGDGTVENGPLAGWKPIRIAVAVEGGDGRMSLRYESDRQSSVIVPPESLRAPATSLRGLRLVAYDALDLVSRVDETIDDAAVDHEWAAGPDDLGLADTTAYSLEWTGQVRIDVGGSYGVRVVSSGGQRLYVDGLLATESWSTAASDETSEMRDLEAGWHDVELAFEGAGACEVALSFAAGSVELGGDVVPIDRFRPVVGSRPGETREANGASYAFGTGGVTDVASAMEVAGPSGATATTVDVAFRLDHADQSQVLVELQSPLGTRAVLRDHVAGSGIRNVTVTDVADFAGEEIDGTWRVWATDEVAATGGVLENVSLTVRYRAPLSLLARSGSYATRVVDLTDGIVSYGEARWSADDSGGGVEVRTRSCPTSATCAVGAWSPALADDTGSPVASPLERFVQMQTRLTGDGQETPIVDWMEMDYEAYDAECVCP